MTPKEMKAILQSGRSVFWRGRLIDSEAHMPTVAEMAIGDPVAEVDAMAELQAQMAELQKQIATLQPPIVPVVNDPSPKK